MKDERKSANPLILQLLRACGALALLVLVVLLVSAGSRESRPSGVDPATRATRAPSVSVPPDAVATPGCVRLAQPTWRPSTTSSSATLGVLVHLERIPSATRGQAPRDAGVAVAAHWLLSNDHGFSLRC